MQESLETSLVRILTASEQVVGAGFLVGEREVLTCAHVVAGALGLADDTPEKPQALVSLDFPRVAPGQQLTARVVLWRPPRADGGDDIAGLELVGEPPSGTQPAPLAQVEDLWEHSFRAFGFPRGQDTGVWATGRLLGRQVTNWVQIEDVKETGFAVEPGFSGTPVWDSQVEAVVGMIVAAEKRMNLKTAFAIPVDVLAGSWPLLESRIHPFVFLCYARADSERVIALKTDLQGQGISIWIDREGLQPGTLDWEEALRTAIRAARAVLLIASPNARSSRYVRDELRIAELYQRPVYPFWIAGTHWMEAVPLGWGGAQYIDARESRYETAIPQLVGLLNTASSTPAKASEPDFEPRNPYKGLRAFNSDDASDFFGRDTLINELATALEGALATKEKGQQCTRLLTVIGPSGSGKSSVVMAGLLPRLQQGRLSGSEQWIYLDPIVPGTRPIEALTLALSEHLPDKSLKAIREDLEDDTARGLHLLATKLAKRPGTKVVLLVDQFEELFTQTPSEDERRHFLDLLVTASTEPRGAVIVLLTLRADFYDRPMRYPQLHQLIQAHQASVLPMAIPELREVIEKPAALPDVQLTFEGDLVGDLLFEVQGQVGALPLLQFTLDQLFQRRSGRQLTLSAYREMGGVKGALTRKAEETYAALPSEEHRKLARALFVRLIDPGATEQDTTRRRAALSEFSLADATQTRQLQEVADAYIAARLLTTNEIAGTTTIEVSHEALIREWPRLAGWLRKARDDIRLQQTISENAAEWEQHNKPGDRLYRGSQLKEARAWARRNIPSGSEATFLRVSAAHQTRSRVGVVTSCILVVLLLLFTGFQNREVFFPPDPTLVTTLADNGPGSLRQAILTAKSGSTIRFDTHLRGVIKLVSNISIDRDLTIRGPGTGILSISGSGGFNVLLVEPWASVIISGLAFRETNQLQKGFGIVINDGTLTLTNIKVSGNSTYDGAGGITNNNTGTLTINKSTISGNKSTISSEKSIGGGGIGNEGTLLLNNCTISDNTTNTGGGGISNAGTLTLTNSTISHNTSSGGGFGGGIGNYGGSLTISNSRIFGNTAAAGAGIFNNSGPLTLSNSTVSDNTADYYGYGGGIHNVNGTLKLTNSTVSNNTAGYGGGINNGYSYGDHAFDDAFNHGGPITLTNSTISDNRATEGGGILANEDSQANIIFCTIYDNAATSEGGGIAIVAYKSNRSGQVKMRNNLVAGNHAPTAPDISGTLTSDGYNLVQDISGANFAPNQQHSTDVSVDPHADLKIDSLLRDHGGLTTSHTFIHALLPSSPAIDKIPLAACHSNGITTDQRGMERPDGNEDRCDIGAFEYADTST
jgi:TIR domain/Trypsin-like peptidase domain/AAA ATPase domain